MLGPVDYVVLGFEGNKFDGSILDELIKSVESGVIRVIDLVFMIKDKDGGVAAGEYTDQPDELKQAVKKVIVNEEDLPLFTEGDIKKVADGMEKNTAAAVLVIEHVWARELKKAIIKAGGHLIADGRIHADKVREAMQDLGMEE